MAAMGHQRGRGPMEGSGQGGAWKRLKVQEGVFLVFVSLAGSGSRSLFSKSAGLFSPLGVRSWDEQSQPCGETSPAAATPEASTSES